MNKEYIYIDGKAIIRDENGKQAPVEYYDNLDKVLVQENLIETIENKIAELEKDSQLYKKNNKKHYIPFILPMSLFMTTVGVNLISYFITGTNPLLYSTNSIFGVVNVATLNSFTYSFILLPMGACFENKLYQSYKYEKRREKGTNSELEFLQKQIIVEKQLLEDLKKEKRRDNENKEFRVVEVDDKKCLIALKNYSNLYFDLGYNEEKYYKYYQQGKLDDKLRKNYTDTDIENAKEYLEEKGPTLVKRKNNQTNL